MVVVSTQASCQIFNICIPLMPKMKLILSRSNELWRLEEQFSPNHVTLKIAIQMLSYLGLERHVHTATILHFFIALIFYEYEF